MKNLLPYLAVAGVLLFMYRDKLAPLWAKIGPHLKAILGLGGAAPAPSPAGPFPPGVPIPQPFAPPPTPAPAPAPGEPNRLQLFDALFVRCEVDGCDPATKALNDHVLPLLYTKGTAAP